MNFNEQIKWIENKIQELKNNNSELIEKIQSDIKALNAILYDYKKANQGSINLSWTMNPDRMGQ